MSSHHASQRFCLRWNNHQSNLLSVFDQLLHDESFVDVTLAVEGQFLRAHKMVLSACSPYFQALFTGHPDKHPIVILKDVPYADMRSLLDFMYRGEVSVDQDRLTAFLKVAESLRIKGLTEVNEERCDLPSIASSLLSSAGFTQQTSQPESQRQTQQQQAQQQQSQPPLLHRIHVPTKRSLQNSMASNPLLGSALTAPKRKRGRPRRLSGSDEHRNQSHKSSTDSEDQRHDDDSDAQSGVHGPPDLLEVNMPDDNHSPPSRFSHSDSPVPSEDSTPLGNDSSDPCKVKPEFDDPTPGTSQQESGGGSQSPKSSSQDSESKLPSEQPKEDVTFTLCDNASESTESSLTPYEHPDLSMIIEDIEMSVTSVKSEPETSEHEDEVDSEIYPSGVHFLTDESDGVKQESKDDVSDLQQQKRELLEYLIQEDNSVICKWCGEVLPSRTHWYRHKYKFHVSSPGNLYKCHKCNAFFKSKKGYMGHVNSRHWKAEDSNGKAKSDVLKLKIVDCNLEGGLTEYKIVNNMALSPKILKRVKSNFENIVTSSVVDEDYEKQKVKYEKEYEKQRQKEEQLVADIIDRVRKECEAQGSTVSRRGYSRRSTVMNSS